jgi:hypothetical protein
LLTSALQTQVFFPILKTSRAWARCQPSTSETPSAVVSSSSSSLAVEPLVVGPLPQAMAAGVVACSSSRLVEAASVEVVVGDRPSWRLAVPLEVVGEGVSHHRGFFGLWKRFYHASYPCHVSCEVALPWAVEEDLQVASEVDLVEDWVLAVLASATCAW